MDEEMSRADQELLAMNDAQYGRLPDPQGGYYYRAAYNEYMEKNAVPPEVPPPEPPPVPEQPVAEPPMPEQPPSDVETY